jgi:chemotaxis protein CheD
MSISPSGHCLFAPRIVIGVGDIAVSNDQNATLSTYALGSCVAVVGYDPVGRVGGMLHLMLPNSKIAAAKALAQPAMFADTGIPLFFRSLIGLKADLMRLRLFVAGGASVLGGKDAFQIGARNLRATEEGLEAQGFGFSSDAVGGTTNRTLHLDIGTGKVSLKTPTGVSEYSLGN